MTRLRTSRRPSPTLAVPLAVVILVASQAASPARADVYPIAVLRALDKVTARVSTMYAPVGETIRFGTLSITTRVCDKRPPEEPPESAAFLTIVETRPDRPASTVFSGWMFASSPGLSPLQHPVYDLWVLDCLASLPSAPANSSGGNSP